MVPGEIPRKLYQLVLGFCKMETVIESVFVKLTISNPKHIDSPSVKPIKT